MDGSVTRENIVLTDHHGLLYDSVRTDHAHGTDETVTVGEEREWGEHRTYGSVDSSYEVPFHGPHAGQHLPFPSEEPSAEEAARTAPELEGM
jgi:hypothetical protein